jgi:outer membrane protein assembly factor BamD
MRKTVVLTLFVGVSVMFGCTTRLAKLEKTADFDELYKGAIAYYEQGKYGKAKLLFEKVSPYYRGTLEAEKVQFYWAYCEYYQRLYTLAAFRFKNFYQTYGRSEYAEEAEYMHAYSLYQDAPDANLDQTSSEEAVVAMQNFLNRRPASQYYVRANEIIDELQVRFETKAYERAKLYYKLSTGLSFRNYLEAALVTFDSFKADFPDSKYNEELMYLSIETNYKLADNSITSRKKERFQKTVAYYNEFLERYPNSEYLAQAQDYLEQSQKELEALNKVD